MAAFHTYPQRGESSRFSIVFGGGAGYTPMYERMWMKIEKYEPKHDATLLLLSASESACMGYNKQCTFGLLDFDMTVEDPQVKYSIVNIDNEVIDSRVMKLSQLSHTVALDSEQQKSVQ
jgi:hypothetical protein